MKTPGKESFDEANMLVKEVLDDMEALVQSIEVPRDGLDEPAFVEAMLAVRARLIKRDSDIEATEFFRWFGPQAERHRFFDAVYGRPKKTEGDAEAAFRSQYQRWLKAADHDGPQMYGHVVRRRLRYYGRHPNLLMLVGLTDALSAYLYGDRASKLVSDARTALHRLKQLKEALQLIDEESKEGNEFISLPVRHRSIGLRLESVKEEEDRLLAFDFPIRRLDETAKERALVYDLWRLFYSTFRANKVRAIESVLNFECVKNRPDSRSVQRMVSGWKKGSR